MLTAILVALVTLQSAQAQPRNDTRTWYQAYADAERHIQQKNWAAAVRDIEMALQRGAPRPGRRVLFYGDVYRDFNPDYYLGVAYLNLHRYVEADRAFERVRRAGLIGPRDPLYAEFSRQSDQARRMIDERSAGAVAEPPPPPARLGSKAPSQPAPSQPTQTPAAGAPPPPASLPAFPWPPPRYSAYAPIAREWVALGVNPSLASPARALEAAFDAAGYGERSYYWVPGGFALVSRIEQIQPDAVPVASPARWAVSSPPMKTGVIDYIRALFNAPPGFYRVIVFVVTDQDFAAGSRAPTSSEARSWIVAGSLRLPEAVRKLPYTDGHYTTALIYEFERRADTSDARVRMPSNSPGRVHLEKAGLWQALSRR